MSYQWYFNGSAIYGANSSSYTIFSVLSLSAGNYYVKVSNSGGSVISDNATLNVIAPPAIITQPQSQTVLKNQSASFYVVASGTGPLSYQWFFNGVSLGIAATNATLSLNNVKAGQAGAYTVVMTNSMGSVTSAVATLTVLVPAGVSTEPQSQSVVQGQSVSFSVVASGTTPISYQWKFNGSPLRGATSSTLTLPNVQTNQAGNYTVLVTNLAGSELSAPANLAVSLPSATLSAQALTSDGFTFQVYAPTGVTYIVLASSDLQTWTPFATNSLLATSTLSATNSLLTATNISLSASVTFTDNTAVATPCRFYRVVFP